jgi:hypothetical protein
MSLTPAIAWLADKATALGAKSAPDTPPEDIRVFPFFVAYERETHLTPHSYGDGLNLGVLYVEYHLGRTMLSTAVTKAYGFRDAFLAALLANRTLGGTVEVWNALDGTFGGMKWDETATIGYRWELKVKEKVNNA